MTNLLLIRHCLHHRVYRNHISPSQQMILLLDFKSISGCCRYRQGKRYTDFAGIVMIPLDGTPEVQLILSERFKLLYNITTAVSFGVVPGPLSALACNKYWNTSSRVKQVPLVRNKHPRPTNAHPLQLVYRSLLLLRLRYHSHLLERLC